MGIKYFKESEKPIIHKRFKVQAGKQDLIDEMQSKEGNHEIDITTLYDFTPWQLTRIHHVFISVSLALGSRNPEGATSNPQKEQAHVWPFYFEPSVRNPADPESVGTWLPSTMPVMVKMNWPYDEQSSHNSGVAKCEVHEGIARFNVLFPQQIEHKQLVRVDAAIAIEAVGINTLLGDDRYITSEDYESQSSWWDKVINGSAAI